MATNKDLLSLQQIQKSDIPVYVIPNKPGGGQRQQYRDPSPDMARSAQDSVNQLVESIQSFRKQNPVKSPVPAGMQTLDSKKLDESKRQYDTSLAEEKRQFDTNFAYKKATAGDNRPPELTKNERIGYVLKGAVAEYNNLMSPSNQKVSDINLNGINYPMQFDKRTPEQAAQEVIGKIYNNLGGADLSVSDASSVIEAFYQAIGLQPAGAETETPKQKLDNFMAEQEMTYYKDNPTFLQEKFERK